MVRCNLTMKRYNPREIEAKWQKIWADQKTFHVEHDANKPKKYIIDMFPYPSGAAMHVGHVRNFTISDVLSQYHRQKGYNVLHTMGWDTFGLPAENYAIKTGTPPAVSTKANIANFKKQLTALGMSYDWDREITTSEPEYYKWTQWIFTKLHEAGLAYQDERAQWWCPECKTVLANEQVVNGCCWRHEDTPVIKKNLKQWFFKITEYADALLEGIDDLDWPEKIKTMQRNWIGKSKGAEITFRVKASENYVLLHGFTGKPSNDFFPWVKKELESLGGSVSVPVLPNTDRPDANEQADFVLRNENINEETILLGHSYGSVTALRIVEKLSAPIKKLVLVAGFAQPGFLDNERNFEKTTDWNFDWNKIRKNVKEVVILRAENDSAVPRERADFLSEKLNAQIIDFRAEGDHATGSTEPAVLASLENKIKVFTTRPDTLFGATYLVLAPEHELTLEIAKKSHKKAVSDYILASQAKSDIERQESKEKTGVFTGAYAINPANGQHIPIWTADYVLAGYGTGAIMAVPAHDERDYAFAEKFDLPVIEVVAKPDGFAGCFTGEGTIINSGSYNGMASSEARDKIVADLAAAGNAEEKVNYKMRDWLISRQRYWGAPIPIIHCPEHGAVSVPEKDLPVVLPEVSSFEPTGEGSVLKTATDWVNTACPVCGGPAERETDTMDGYACSSWYFLRYADPHNSKQAWDPDIANYWLPVDYYCGGDHAVSHLLYSRFWMHFFADQGWIEKTRREPVRKLVYNGYILAHDGQKMSKSKGNVVNPDDLIEQGYGADSVRLFEMFIAPYEQNTNWNTNGVPGTFRFLQRFWTLVQEYLETAQADGVDETVLKAAHKAIYKTSDQLDRLQFNNAVSSLMETVNDLYKIKAKTKFAGGTSWRFALESVTKLLAPFAPHVTEEIWQLLGHNDSVHINNWPVHDPVYLAEDTVSVAVQINGKVRGSVTVPADATQEDVEQAARADERVATYLQAEPKKVIYVPGRLISFVI